MPTKFEVVQVTVRHSSRVDKYAKTSANAAHMKELLRGVADRTNWTVTASKEGRVTGGYPEVTKHKSHGQGKEWKLQVDPGNRSQDRLWVKVTDIQQEPSKTKKDVINVKFKAAVEVEEDTHKRDARK